MILERVHIANFKGIEECTLNLNYNGLGVIFKRKPKRSFVGV